MYNSRVNVFINKRRTYARFKNRSKGNYSGTMLTVLMKALRRDVDIFIENYLREMLTINLVENTNNRIFGNSTNGYLNPLATVPGLENLLIDF